MSYLPNPHRKKKLKLFSLVLFLFALVLGIGGTVYMFVAGNISPEDSSALLGGVIDNDSYNSSGFLLAYDKNRSPSICGTVYLTPKLAISAAHCFDEKVDTYLSFWCF